MSAGLAYHCCAPGCDTWVRVGPMSFDWITVTEGDVVVGRYCSLDHTAVALGVMSAPSREVEL